MLKNKNEPIDFIVDGIIFRFEKKNYEKHVLKRPRIAEGLARIKETLNDPDCITKGPGVQETYYKVFNYRDEKATRYITYWKIPVYYKGIKLRIIATAIYTTSPNFYAIHELEKTIWKKPNSQI